MAARWRPLLGDDLARRVAKVAPDPAAFCVEAVRAAVVRAESTGAGQTAEQRKCAHPDAQRRYNRCGACGLRGLPPAAKVKA